MMKNIHLKFFCNRFQNVGYLLSKGFEIFYVKIRLYNEAIKVEIIPKKTYKEYVNLSTLLRFIMW